VNEIKVLIVDDSAFMRKLIGDFLACDSRFHVVGTARNGEEGLKKAFELSPDIVTLDIEMPKMNGWEFCSKVRKTPLNGTTPVIFVTRSCDFQSRARSIQSGGQDLIAKPFLRFEIAVKALTFAIRGRLECLARSSNHRSMLLQTAGR